MWNETIPRRVLDEDQYIGVNFCTSFELFVENMEKFGQKRILVKIK